MTKRLLLVSDVTTLKASELKPREWRWPDRSSPAGTGWGGEAIGVWGELCAKTFGKAAAGMTEAADLRKVRRWMDMERW
jgi:hypothetical protein